jgi:hypothetical protein
MHATSSVFAASVLILACCAAALPAPGKGFFERECQGNSTCEQVFAKEAVGLLGYWSARSSPYLDPVVAKEELESSSFLLMPSLLAAGSEILVSLSSCPSCTASNPQACVACVSKQWEGSRPHAVFLIVADQSISSSEDALMRVAAKDQNTEWLQASRNAENALGEKLIGLVRIACLYASVLSSFRVFVLFPLCLLIFATSSQSCSCNSLGQPRNGRADMHAYRM